MTPLFRRSRQQRLSAHRRAAGLLVAGMCALLGQYAAAQEQVTRLDVLREAWNVARTIPSLSQRASALADVGLALQPLDPAQGLEALNEAGFAAVSVPSQVEQALALQAVARRLEKVDAGRAEGLFRTAITSV